MSCWWGLSSRPGAQPPGPVLLCTTPSPRGSFCVAACYWFPPFSSEPQTSHRATVRGKQN